MQGEPSDNKARQIAPHQPLPAPINNFPYNPTPPPSVGPSPSQSRALPHNAQTALPNRQDLGWSPAVPYGYQVTPLWYNTALGQVSSRPPSQPYNFPSPREILNSPGNSELPLPIRPAPNDPSSQLYYHGADHPDRSLERERDELYRSFKRKQKVKKFFVFGKVFLTLWAEPAGESSSSSATSSSSIPSGISVGSYGERVHSKIRRFVVVREGDTYCQALPILTYNRQGVGKHATSKAEHAIIYTGREPPEPTKDERTTRGGGLLLPHAIRVDVDDIAERLDPHSRVNFGQVYTVQHNVKVKSFGKVNAISMAALNYQFRQTWDMSLSQTIKVNPSLRASTLGDVTKRPSQSGVEASEDWEDVSGSHNTEHPDVHACAREVASFLRSQGFSQQAKELEQRMSDIQATDTAGEVEDGG